MVHDTSVSWPYVLFFAAGVPRGQEGSGVGGKVVVVDLNKTITKLCFNCL